VIEVAGDLQERDAVGDVLDVADVAPALDMDGLVGRRAGTHKRGKGGERRLVVGAQRSPDGRDRQVDDLDTAVGDEGSDQLGALLQHRDRVDGCHRQGSVLAEWDLVYAEVRGQTM
jgi:hypothetical protein